MSAFPFESHILADLIQGNHKGQSNRIDRVVIDTRVPLLAGDLYIGLKGARFDGGDYGQQAWEKGANTVLCASSHPLAAQNPPEGKTLIVVDDPLIAMQALAAHVRQQYQGTVVGITGSNGKTTIKEMLRAILGRSFRVYASPLSWNSQVGVAMTLLQLDFGAEIALIECGISKPGEMTRLVDMVQPDIGVFTNVGDAHRETLLSSEITAREKAILFSKKPNIRVFVPCEETAAISALRAVGATNVVVGEVDKCEGHANVQWEDNGRQMRFYGAQIAMPVIPVGLRVDAALAVVFARVMDVGADAIAQGFSEWTPAPMRLEMMRTSHGVYVLNDAYSADPESFDVAIRSLQQLGEEGRSIAVVGPLAQLGQARAAAHARVGKTVADATLERVILVGPDAVEIGKAAEQAGLPASHILYVQNATEAAMALDGIVRRGDRVLVKASRPEHLERVVDLLFDSVGPTVAHIDLETLAKNFDRMRAIVGKDVAIMPVVKSFGYGLDSVRLGRLFVRCGAEALAVAYADEGIVLRERGLDVPIVVLNPMMHELEKIVTHDLSVEIVDPEIAEALQKAAALESKKVGVHIKVDTGMGRSGLLPDAALDTVRTVLSCTSLQIQGLMTHLANADVAGQEAFTQEQIARFTDFVTQAKRLGAQPRWIHAANTAGAVRFPDARFNMVRSGIGLLGYADLPDQRPFDPVMRLTTRVVAVKGLPEGAPVGYGSTWHVPQGAGERLIAVVALGYNDGYPRHLSNRGWMSIHGHACPVVGNVCMDVTMLDATDVPRGVRKGDLVVAYGTRQGEPDLSDMAARAGTISYELLTRIAPRVRRIFVGEISGSTMMG